MINVDRKNYDYFILGAKNAYGQQTLPGKDAKWQNKYGYLYYFSSNTR